MNKDQRNSADSSGGDSSDDDDDAKEENHAEVNLLSSSFFQITLQNIYN